MYYFRLHMQEKETKEMTLHDDYETALQVEGRAMAGALIQTAVETASTPETMSRNLALLRIAAFSILAADIFNRVKQFKDDPKELLALHYTELSSEYDLYESDVGEIKTLMIGSVEGMTPQ